jgi:hypothetical protein
MSMDAMIYTVVLSIDKSFWTIDYDFFFIDIGSSGYLICPTKNKTFVLYFVFVNARDSACL